MSLIHHKQFNNICRTCLSEAQNMKSIFDTDGHLGETLQLFQVLMACTSVQMQEDDGLPAQICLSCIESVARSFSFKKLCEDSDATLREVLRKSTMKESDPSIALKSSSDVALCAQETVTDIDTDLLDTQMKFEEGETKIGDCLISDMVYTDHEEDIEMMNNAEDLSSETIEPNVSIDADDVLAYLTGERVFKIFANPRRKLPHRCEVCNKGFANSGLLNEHTKAVHGDAKSFRCHQCGRGFTCVRNLTRHLRAHLEAHPFLCKLCDKRFAQPHELLAHERIHANQNQDLICAECGRGFTHPTAFKFHQNMHLRIKKCLCNICGKQFSNKSILNTHMKVHTGEKEHVCPQCGKGFAVAGNLRVHERFHTGEILFMCEVCGRGYVTHSQLKQHMPVHTGEKPFQCHLCPNKFSHRGILQEHIRRHNGSRKRTHICDYCQKGFYDAAHLRKHLRTHTGEKPHTCIICNKSFTRADNLKVHLNSH